MSTHLDTSSTLVKEQIQTNIDSSSSLVCHIMSDVKEQ